jgi:hypothetical protein
MQGKGTLLYCWLECKLVQLLWKSMWRSLKKLKMELPYDPTTALLSIYRRNGSQHKIETPAYPCLLQQYSQ